MAKKENHKTNDLEFWQNKQYNLSLMDLSEEEAEEQSEHHYIWMNGSTPPKLIVYKDERRKWIEKLHITGCVIKKFNNRVKLTLKFESHEDIHLTGKIIKGQLNPNSAEECHFVKKYKKSAIIIIF